MVRGRMTLVPGSTDGFDVDIVIPPDDTIVGIDLMPMEGSALDLSLTRDEDVLNLVLGGDGPTGPSGPTGPQGRSITTTESGTAPANPQPADVWVNPGPPRAVWIWDGAAWVLQSTGPTGPAGPQGPPGGPGPAGPTGAVGPVSTTPGPAGPTG